MDLDYIPKVKRKSTPKKQKPKQHAFTITKPKKNNENYYLGEIWFGKTNNVLPETWDICKGDITSKDDEDTLLLYFDSTLVVITLTTDAEFLKSLLYSRSFSMKFHLNEENIITSLYLNYLPLVKFYPKLGSVIKTVFSIIFNVSCDYNDIQRIKSSSVIETFPDLYKNISLYRDRLTDRNVQHSQLKPRLRRYQEDAVRWMIHREQKAVEDEMLHPLYEKITLNNNIDIYYDKYTGFIDGEMPMTKSLITGGILADEMGLGKTVEVLACILSHPSDQKQSTTKNDVSSSPTIEKQSKKRKIRESTDEPDPDYIIKPKKIKVPDNWVKSKSKKGALRVALESWYNSVLSTDKPEIKIPKIQCICGETVDMEDNVECCSCSKIQHGQCLGYESSYGPFYCPQCWMEMPLVETHGTLIVTPGSLNEQWCQEICKHVSGSFKVLQYKSGLNLAPVYPTKLQQYDIVITTYSVLQSELRLSENGQVVSLRRPPKYSLPGSPITRIKWWRLCLDEAQTVETPGHMVSEMAKKLTAHHRWAVTGTPISKDISDLYGLIDYLQFSPYSEVDTWSSLLYKPYINGRKQPMHEFLAKILWRTAKKDVLDQINIPQQTTKEYWLEFAAVEKFFYQREHELCSKEFLQRLKNLDLNVPLNSMDKNVLRKIMQPLLALRQACGHHQAVRGKYLATRKQVSSMEDLLNALIAKNITESEEYLRAIIASLNGLAGVYLLLQNPLEAVEQYRQVLQLYSRFSNDPNMSLDIDKLQLIHTMYNLADVLGKYPNIPPTLRDSSMKEECLNLEKEYMERFAKQSVQVQQDNLKYSANIAQLQEKFLFSPGQWFSDTLDWISTNNLFEDYLTRLTTTLHTANISVKDKNERQILYTVTIWDEEITQLKEELLDAIHDLFTSSEDMKIEIPTEVMEAATDCHLRPQKNQNKSKNKERCPVCLANTALKQYESKLFSTTKKNDDISNAGNWKPAAEEFILRALHSLGRQKNLDPDLLHDAEVHFQILDILKKEFKEIRKLWTYIDTQICAKDELDMCKIRLSLKEKTYDDEENQNSRYNRLMKQLNSIQENKFETIHMLSEHEVLYQRTILSNESKVKSMALEKNLGTYKYLQTLHTQQTSGQTPDPCPICKNTLDKQWNILSCGHCYCVECIQTLLGQNSGQHIQCSICRSKQPISDITYIHTDTQKEENTDSKIKGDCSTKIEAIVRLVVTLKQDDPNVKVLIFSKWQTILKVLNKILDNNDIKNEILKSQNFDRVLEKFKNKSKGVTVLLLPISLGSKGLNLIEATHVVFVEPLLNPGDELQAIGRIHRIGQTKPTVVHKFYVKNTVEENIYHATTSTTEEWDADKITLRHIKQLFEVSATVEVINEIEDATNSTTDGVEEVVEGDSVSSNNYEDAQT